MKIKPTTRYEFVRLLADAGASIARHNNGHEQWRLPNGRMFTLPVSRGAWIPAFVHQRWRDLTRVLPELRALWEATR